MTGIVIKVVQSRWRCSYLFPVMSQGGIVVAEEPCLLARGHDGPHRGASGAVAVNTPGTLRLFDQGKA